MNMFIKNYACRFGYDGKSEFCPFYIARRDLLTLQVGLRLALLLWLGRCEDVSIVTLCCVIHLWYSENANRFLFSLRERLSYEESWRRDKQLLRFVKYNNTLYTDNR